MEILKNTKRIVQILLLLTVLVFSNRVYSATMTVPSNVSEPYDWHTGMYCAEPGDGLGLVDENGNLSETVTYEINEFNNVTIEPSTGFAYYVAKSVGLNDQDMQKVVWSSRQWGNDSNVLDKVGHDSNATSTSSSIIQSRSYQYGTTYYGLIKEAIEENKSVLKTEKVGAVRVLVDQLQGTYTVGPYKLSINTNSNDYTKRAAQLFYNELVGEDNKNTKYAKFIGISGLNGKDAKFVDEKGKEIKFPNFIPGEEKEFYIRFKPNNDGAIVETGSPILNISYITSFKAGTLLKYVPVSVQFGNTEESSSSSNAATQQLGTTQESRGQISKFEVDYSKGVTVECDYVGIKIIRDGSKTNNGGWKGNIKIRGEFIIKVKTELSYFGNNKAPFYQLYRVYIEDDKEPINIKNESSLNEEEEKIKSKYEKKYKTNPYAGSYIGEEINTSCKVQPSNSTIIQDNEYGTSWLVTPFNDKVVIERDETENYDKNGIIKTTENSEENNGNNIETFNEYSNDNKESGIIEGLRENSSVISINNELGANSSVPKSSDWVAKEPNYINHMLAKLKKYGSKTEYGCMVDTDLCRLTIFKKNGNSWSLVAGWNSIQGINAHTRADVPDWYGPRSRSFKGAWRVIGKWKNANGGSNNYTTCYVPSKHDQGAYGGDNCQRFEYVAGRPNTDTTPLNKRFLSQGCCVLNQDRAIWVFNNIPVDTTVVVFDKWNPMPNWNAWDNNQSVSTPMSKDVEPEKITGGQAIAEAAVALACRAEPEKQLNVEWPWTRLYDDRTKAYVDAREKLVKGKNSDGGDYGSCDMGVAVAVRYSGVDPNMEYKTIPNIWPYLKNSSNWKKAGTLNWNNYSNLQPGDVLINSHHILIYVGNEIIKKKYPNSKADIYEAGYSSYKNGSYYPSLKLLSWKKGDDEYTIFRHINANKKMYESKEGFLYLDSSGGDSTELTSTYVVSDAGAVSSIQNVVQVPSSSSSSHSEQPSDSGEDNVKENWKNISVKLESAPINTQIGGRVWLENISGKDGNPSGKLDDGDQNFGGIQVSLYEMDNESDTTPTLVATTITDENGKYRFYGKKEDGKALVNGLKKYSVLFTYNGQYYQATYYKKDLTGGFSNAKEIGREEFNKKFETLYSSDDNYKVEDNWNKAYAISQKIENDNGDYIEHKYGEKDEEKGALTFEDVYYEFLLESRMSTVEEIDSNDYKEMWKRNKTYEEVLNGSLKEWLANRGVTKDYEKIKGYIKDTLINSTTFDGGELKVLYPENNEYIVSNIDSKTEEYKLKETRKITLDKTYTNVYSINSDQSRNIDFGVYNRVMNDIALQKDVYNVAVIVNGKKQDYKYSEKDVQKDGTWDIKARANDVLYNGKEAYEREVRKSEYLYDGSDAGTSDIKNIQVYVTYRISVKNQGDVRVKIDEIADYYDIDAYEFDGELNDNTYRIKEYRYGATEEKKAGQDGEIYVNSYIGSDEDGSKIGDISIRAKSIPNLERGTKEIKGENYNYSTLYLSEIKNSKGEELFNPGDIGYAYITFKAKKDESTGKVKIDEDIKDGTLKIGKRNIAEINAYSTYYREGQKIANNFEGEEKEIGVSGKVAGLIDKDSAPGSLKERDLNTNGDIIINAENIAIDRQEDDTDKSPNIRIVIDKDDKDIRKIQGYVYEDERNIKSDDAVIGNGKYDEDETKINGVTLQLIELVQKVDENGVFTGEYEGEKVWGSYTYNGTDIDSLDKADKDYSRYYSGKGISQIIINGPTGTILHVENDTKLAEGEYIYKSVPAGDFYIRFIYGDTAQTALTNNEENEVNKLLNNEGVDGQKGLNKTSYNGQDYKTTVYQRIIGEKEKDSAEINQDTIYNGIRGFMNYENQNYYIVEDLNVNTESDYMYNQPNPDKEKMYYYSISESRKLQGVSDAKDIYSYREIVNNWSKGENGETLLNNRAEVLASFEKIGTYKAKNDNGEIDQTKQKETQENMIRELMKNTKMVAQTGIINTEIEYNRQKTTYGEDSLNYTIDDVNLGLTERAEAGIKINKEVESFNLVLSNGQEVFDANKSVQNLYFGKHEEHKVEYNNLGIIREVILNKNKDNSESELIQGYVDNEMMQGATVKVKYKIKVENIGEVDYKDKEFYYKGKTIDKSENNISKTSVVKLVDYISNTIKFDVGEQENDWRTISAEELIGSTTGKSISSLNQSDNSIEKDYINREFSKQVSSYNTIISTEDLSEELSPSILKTGTHSKEIKLLLSTQVSGNIEDDNLVYNNLVEIIETSNELGRKNKYSIVGNQEMADQSLGKDANENEKTRFDRIEVDEIDADSSQKIVLMPPTGEKAKYGFIILLGISIIVIGTFIIKKVLNRKL